MIKSIPRTDEKLAVKMMIATLDKNVSDIMISAWLIEASASLRYILNIITFPSFFFFAN